MAEYRGNFVLYSLKGHPWQALGEAVHAKEIFDAFEINVNGCIAFILVPQVVYEILDLLFCDIQGSLVEMGR